MTIELDPEALAALADRGRSSAQRLAAVARVLGAAGAGTAVDTADPAPGVAALPARLDELVEMIRGSSEAVAASASDVDRVARRTAALDGAGSSARCPIAPGPAAGLLPSGMPIHLSVQDLELSVSLLATIEESFRLSLDRYPDGRIVATIAINGTGSYVTGEGASVRPGRDRAEGRAARFGGGVAIAETMTFVFADLAETRRWLTGIGSRFDAMAWTDRLVPLPVLLHRLTGTPAADRIAVGSTSQADLLDGDGAAAVHLSGELTTTIAHDLRHGPDQLQLSAKLSGSAGVGSVGLTGLSALGAVSFRASAPLSGARPTSLDATLSVELGARADVRALAAWVPPEAVRAVTRALTRGESLRLEVGIRGAHAEAGSLTEFLADPRLAGATDVRVYAIDHSGTDLGASVELDGEGQVGASVTTDTAHFRLIYAS